jgi:Large eukaryotic DNA virus major capsid protein/Major capsid protein N-terminus
MSFSVSGFYGPSPVSNILSVYLTQPGSPIKKGMVVQGLVGIPGTAVVVDFASNVYGDVVITPGPPAVSFPYIDVVTVQVKNGMRDVNVSPSSILQLTFSPPMQVLTSNVFRGPLITANVFTCYITDDSFTGNVKNWSMTGLDVFGNIKVTSDVTFLPGTSNALVGTQIVPTHYYYSYTATTDQLQIIPIPGSIVQVTFKPPIQTLVPTNYGLYDPRLFDDTEIKGQPADLRDLNSNVQVIPAPKEAYIEMGGRGFGTGALTALAAIGAQEKYMFGGKSLWMPEIKQHTPFAITQRMLLPLVNGGGRFLDSTKIFSVNIYPRDSGDLLANMYLSVSLPALPTGYNYTPLVGRAIITQVEFLIDGTPIEKITDDWYIIRDQLFLDADEKLAMYQAVSAGQSESNVVPATQPIQMMIPLEFFFCRRHTHGIKSREKLEKPFFPMCAIRNQIVTIRFTFCNPSWITNAPTDVDGKVIDIINPRIIVEEITLSPSERIYYQSKTLKYKINHVWAEAGLPYNGNKAVMNLTANFPVSMITWFVRNKLYETQNSAFYASRYQYGYTTDYIHAAVPVTFFNGVSINFLDIVQTATIYLNNENILSNFPGSLYYSYKQPLDHGLSVPTKNIYMYCFSNKPREYNQEGLVDFSTLNSVTTHLDLVFDPTFAISNYTMYLYYYGYNTLTISNGYATLTNS